LNGAFNFFKSKVSVNPDYLRKVGELITKSRAAFALPPLSTEELDIARKVWYRVLQPEIPLNRLEETLFEVIRARSSQNTATTSGRYAPISRAVHARDVLIHWREANYASAEKNRLKQILGQKVCCTCNDTGYITLYSPDTKQDVKKPCPFHAGLK
jgi:hypothetical protein